MHRHEYLQSCNQVEVRVPPYFADIPSCFFFFFTIDWPKLLVTNTANKIWMKLNSQLMSKPVLAKYAKKWTLFSPEIRR